jgi:hypothetical protein
LRRILLAFALLVSVISCTAAPAPSHDRAGVAHAAAGETTRSDDSLPTIENAPPALEAIAHESRGLGITRAPAQRDVLAERLATTTIPVVSVPLRTPTIGIVVPSCHPLLRWCVAHATATSPA